MEGKRFPSDFTKAIQVNEQTKLLVQTGSNAVQYATVKQLGSVIGGSGSGGSGGGGESAAIDFFQAPKLMVERLCPATAGEDIVDNAKSPLVTITHPYYDEHPNDCFFALMKRSPRMRRKTTYNGFYRAYISKKKWNFFKGGLQNLNYSPDYADRNLPVPVPDTVRAQDILSRFLERGVLRLDTGREDEIAYMLGPRLADDTPAWSDQVGYSTMDDFQFNGVFFGNIRYRKRKTLAVGISLVMQNPDFTGQDNQNWDGNGVYRWLVSEPAPFRLVAINDNVSNVKASITI